MNENFNGMNGQNSVYRPVNTVTIKGMNNTTYIYSSVNIIQVYGSNQIIYCNYANSRVNSINLTGMNNTVYINHNSNLCAQNVYGVNNRIIFTDVQNDNNFRENQINNLNPFEFNIQNSQGVLGGSSALLRNSQNNDNNENNNNMNENNSNINIRHSNNNNLDNENNNNINDNINQSNNRDINQNRSSESENNINLPLSGSININKSNHSMNNCNDNNSNINNDDEFFYEKRNEHDIIEDEKCNICNTKFKNSDYITKMQCGHIYHKFCHDKFKERQINNANFPLCLVCFQWEMQDSINK